MKLMSLGERLSQLRKKTNWTQDDVARKLGIARTTYAMYEQGRREPDAETLSQLAELFEVTVDYLLGRENVPDNTSTDSPISPEEREFLAWVEENLEDSFFYDFSRSPEESKREMMETLRFIWEREKRRRPGQKQGD
jgi:transcriptional regulator with XRE-family HTH domain